LEGAGGYYQQKTAYGEECQGIKLELGEAGAAEDDAGGMLMCSVLGFI
jgi:hypothetical protein